MSVGKGGALDGCCRGVVLFGVVWSGTAGVLQWVYVCPLLEMGYSFVYVYHASCRCSVSAKPEDTIGEKPRVFQSGASEG